LEPPGGGAASSTAERPERADLAARLVGWALWARRRRGRRAAERFRIFASGRRRRRVCARAAAGVYDVCRAALELPPWSWAATIEPLLDVRSMPWSGVGSRDDARLADGTLRLTRHELRARLLLGFGAVVLVPLTVFGWRFAR